MHAYTDYPVSVFGNVCGMSILLKYSTECGMFVYVFVRILQPIRGWYTVATMGIGICLTVCDT